MSKRTVTPGHIIEDPSGAAGTVLDDMQEDDSGVYAPDMAPLAAQPSPDTEMAQAVAGLGISFTTDGSVDPSMVDAEAPAVNPDETANEETPAFTNEFVTIALVKGATYRFRGGVFTKDTPVPVPASIAARLIATGFFERR